MQVEHGTWIIIADGQKYLALRNRGDADFLHLEVVAHESEHTPPARDLASDRPGRRNDAARATPAGVQAWGKSAMEQTDWHRVAEGRFVEALSQKLSAWAQEGRFAKLVLVADPQSLGALRGGLAAGVKALVLAEIAKDLTQMPLDRIEAVIAGHQI